MNRHELSVCPLPSVDALAWAPECAFLAALDATLAPVIDTLQAQHHALDTDEEPGDPLRFRASRLLAALLYLHGRIVAYLNQVDEWTLQGGERFAPLLEDPPDHDDHIEDVSDAEDDIPF